MTVNTLLMSLMATSLTMLLGLLVHILSTDPEDDTENSTRFTTC